MRKRQAKGGQRFVLWARAYVRVSSPIAFIARRFIAEAGKEIGFSKKTCVDLGAGTSPYIEDIENSLGVDQYISIDIAPTDSTSVVADICVLPIRTDSVDIAVSFDTIQHVQYSDVLLQEVARILKPDGWFILTFPFLYAECDFKDYQRWTIDGMVDMLSRNNLEAVICRKRGGFCFALALAVNWAFQHLIPGQRKSWRARRAVRDFVRAGLVFAFTAPILLLSWFALGMDMALSRQSGAYMGGAIAARKRSVGAAATPVS